MTYERQRLVNSIVNRRIAKVRKDEQAQVNREIMAEAITSIRRVASVIKNKDKDWSDGDVLDELMIAMEYIEKAGYTLEKKDLI